MVDVDGDTLIQNIWKIQPKPSDYINPREQPLKIDLLLANVANYNSYYENTDSIIAIELLVLYNFLLIYFFINYLLSL